MKKLKLVYQLYKNRSFFIKIPEVFRMLKEGIFGGYSLNKKRLIIPFLIFIYIISPLDFIPDFLPFIGFLDDLGLIIIAFSKLTEELEDFYLWEKNKK